jgi:predicted pyridoxine 5'-phosphate oxidase superfamily flavin-nucleotide-binding protein
MPNTYHEIAFTPAVKAVQEAEGSRAVYAKYETSEKPMKTELSEPEMMFLRERDSFYMASVSETGWPYMQHRGGPVGFVKTLSAQEFGWAEYVGNRQYITTGNLAGEDRVSLFFMDYASKNRLKLFGHARVIAPGDPLMAQLSDGAGAVQVERGMVVRVASYEWNCPKYISERYGRAEVQGALAQMGARIKELENALAAKG